MREHTRTDGVPRRAAGRRHPGRPRPDGGVIGAAG
ncbi:hypothetical protein PLANTIT3_100134 [Plantibacter sp. T3]|nr:hypothetical protein PLANTIT3_100134 [Plantibacter sp. T3]